MSTRQSEQLTNLDRAHLWHPYTKMSAQRDGLPIMRRGEGLYLVDVNGRRYLDAISSWWSCSLGHGHPRLLAALKNQADLLQHCILGNQSHGPAIELAAALTRLMPSPQRHVMFASDGACAVEAALKIALQAFWNRGERQRVQLACLDQAYHGDTLGAVSVGFLECFHAPFRPVVMPAHRLPVPLAHDQEAECLQAAEQWFEQHGKQTAALIVEPLCQGASGMRMYSAEYLKALGTLCHNCGALLIADEIATGFARTGTMFAFEQAELDPDVVCLGKALSAGQMPISATVVKDDLFKTFDDIPENHTFYHGHTFAGHPLSAAVALEALRIYAEQDIVACSRKLGAVLRDSLRAARGHASVRQVRCLGSIGAVEFHGAHDTPQGFKARRVQARLLEQDILTRPLGNMIYLMPPLVTPPDLCANTARKLVAAIEQTD